MREIKFRAWDMERYRYDIGEVMLPTNFTYESNKYRYIFEQYTGLKDKNGVEIYENDIVKNSNTVKQIVYSEDIAAFEAVTKTGAISLYGCKNIEVIGNIHENKELL